jgi:hypothetical protein
MNSNWGLVDPLPRRVRDKKEKRRILAARAHEDFVSWLDSVGTEPAVDPASLEPAPSGSAAPAS